MADEQLFMGATLWDRFVAAATQEDEGAAQQLSRLPGCAEDLIAQRKEAFALLSAASDWAAKTLAAVGIGGVDTTPVTDAEVAFDRGQLLESKLFELSQLPSFHDREAGLVDAVKRAAYVAAELGPVPGGRLGSFARGPMVVHDVSPDIRDLQEVGSDLGEALRRFDELGHGDIVSEVWKAVPDGRY